MRLISALLRQLEYRPNDLFFWEGVLSETNRMVARLCEHVDWECARLEQRGARESADVRYWREALAARMAECLAELYALAPWLAEPYESELRLRAADPTMTEVMAALCRVPEFADLPSQYERIELAIRRRMESGDPLPPALKTALEGLLEALDPARRANLSLVVDFEAHATAAATLAREMDFAFLFDRRRKLLRIGYDAVAGTVDPSYYDLLASEARTAVFLAIAKGDVPREAWFHLGRKLTSHLGHRSLLSWSGTMFEYLMPCLWLKVHNHTLLGESLRTAVRIQQAFGREWRIPWGVSEAAYAARDSALNYQYQAFGIPGLAVNPRAARNVVVAPYASVLALLADRAAATENLRVMAARGWMGACGFYESVDFTAGHRHPVLVRAFMAHHQGMSLLALANVLLDGVVQKRFHAEPQVLATEFLLQERVPAMVDEKPEARLPASATALLAPPELDRRQAFG
jgi:cyclic beta-1,2-glucan synthetase